MTWIIKKKSMQEDWGDKANDTWVYTEVPIIIIRHLITSSPPSLLSGDWVYFLEKWNQRGSEGKYIRLKLEKDEEMVEQEDHKLTLSVPQTHQSDNYIYCSENATKTGRADLRQAGQTFHS